MENIKFLAYFKMNMRTNFIEYRGIKKPKNSRLKHKSFLLKYVLHQKRNWPEMLVFFKYSGRSKDTIGLTIWNYHCMIISPKNATLMFNDII